MKSDFFGSKGRKGQVSVEYLIIIGVSFAILLPGAYFFYDYSQSSNEAAIRSQINQIGNTIIVNSESIYGLGEGSLVSVDLRYPKNIRDIYILSDTELVIRYELSSGINEAVFFSKIPISGTYAYPSRNPCTTPCGDSSIVASTLTEPGNYKVKFISQTNHVSINVST